MNKPAHPMPPNTPDSVELDSESVAGEEDPGASLDMPVNPNGPSKNPGTGSGGDRGNVTPTK